MLLPTFHLSWLNIGLPVAAAAAVSRAVVSQQIKRHSGRAAGGAFANIARYVFADDACEYWR